MNNEKESPAIIEPLREVGSYKQHSIVGLNAAAIAKKIGFAANVQDDPNKVKFSWAFSVNGQTCAVWDWKGSYLYNEWSAYGPVEALKLVFGDAVRSDPGMSLPDRRN